jgi:short subunit dehydrogenase-like uncharacterized protein
MQTARDPQAHPYDVVLLGATGYTGQLVAEQLLLAARSEPVRLALAGRSLSRLEAVRAALAQSFPEAAELPLLEADTTQRTSLDALARSTRVVCTTVGPYALHGSEVVAACVAAGTDVCDLTGEVHWMRRMIDAHEAAARSSGARVVHACGFDSLPSDLGVLFAQEVCKQRFGEYGRRVTGMVTDARGGFSGGTAASMLELAREAAHDRALRRLLVNPYALNPDPSFRGADGRDTLGVGREPHFGRWTAPFIMAGVNTRVVRRSHALAGQPYGADFSYQEFTALPAGLGGLAQAVGLSVGLSVGVAALASPLRPLLAKRLPKPGEGPSAEVRARGRFTLRFVAEVDERRWAAVEVSDPHADPGYGSTSKMLAQAALSLALDPPSVGGGFWTPATALGLRQRTRLERVGLRFTVLDAG